MKLSIAAICAVLVSSAFAQSNGVPAGAYSEMFADLDYAGDGAVYHKLDIYLPADTAESYPVAIHFYGSAWSQNDMKGSADLKTIVKALLEAGYAVAVPNYRSSSDAIYPAQLHDCKAAIRFVRANAAVYGFDTSFVAVSGFSSGAHLAGLVATTCGLSEGTSGSVTVDLVGDLGDHGQFSSCVDAAALWSPPTDLYTMNPISGFGGGTFEGALIGAEREGNKDKYMVASSPFYASEDDPPIVMFHGDGDQIVNKEQSQELYDSLVAHGVTTAELVYVEGGTHGSAQMYSEENLARMTDFLDSARARKAAARDSAADTSSAISSAPRAPGLENATYAVYSLTGALISRSAAIDERRLRPGVYFVVATTPAGDRRIFRFVRK